MEVICRPYIGDLRPARDVKRLTDAGFTNTMLDISMLCGWGEFDAIKRANFKREPDRIYLSEQPDKIMDEAEWRIIKPARDNGLQIPIAMAPYIKSESKCKENVNSLLTTMAQESLKTAVKAGCESIIINPLVKWIEPGDEWEVNKEYYLSIAKLASELDSDIMILLKNCTKDINGHDVRGICSEPQEACMWVDELNEECTKAGYVYDGHERFGMCVDLGAVTMAGQDPYETIVPVGSRLKAMIIRDCDGVHDAAMLPFTACVRGQQTDWLSLIRGLRKVDFDGALIYDFTDTFYSFTELLKPTFLKLAYETADLIRWHIGIERMVKSYDSRVLFGAGNMCRAYMKDYGKDYPPLFTCDNNSARWGEEFYGLTIENPEKLKTLPPDTAIFICNIYYNEIEAQLKAWNLPNPIEWFNDEYMPTFYTERLEMSRAPLPAAVTDVSDNGGDQK